LKASDLYPREYFNFPEFKKEDLEHMDADFIVNLQRFRSLSAIPMTPSPAPGALWRTDTGCGQSQHCAVDRLSDACDLFPARGRELECFLKALQFPQFGGVGLYADTTLNGRRHIMIHLDSRPYSPLYKSVWLRAKGVYHGQMSKDFYKILHDMHKSIDRVVSMI